MDDVAQGIDPELRAEGLGVVSRDVRVGGTDALAPQATASTLLRTATTTGPPHMNSCSAERGRALQVRVQLARARASGASPATDRRIRRTPRPRGCAEPAANGVGLDEAVSWRPHARESGRRRCGNVTEPCAVVRPQPRRRDGGARRSSHQRPLRADSQRREKRSHADFTTHGTNTRSRIVVTSRRRARATS